jgi:hypothetical protein
MVSDEEWVPGDPVYQEDPGRGECPGCGCQWYPADATNECPECDPPVALVPLHTRKSPRRTGETAPPYPQAWYPGCPCYACDSSTWPTWADWLGLKDEAKEADNRPMPIRMSLCPNCGNKRCPGAKDHTNECTGSNDPGQPNSLYADALTPTQAEAEAEEHERGNPDVCNLETGYHSMPHKNCPLR